MTRPQLYEAEAFCRNCGYEGPVTCEVGQPVYEFPCPVCQCKWLHAEAQREWERDRKVPWLP